MSEEEVSNLNLLATTLLDFAENQARRGILMTMEEWATKLDAYLELSNYDALQNSGTISTEQAKQKAEIEYENFRKTQDRDYLSDFDNEVNKLTPPK